MNYTEFLAKLSEIGKGQFHLDPVSGQVRSKFDELCPICYVARFTLGAHYYNYDYKSAGRALGLSYSTINYIVDGADTSAAVTSRRQLKEALGLDS